MTKAFRWHYARYVKKSAHDDIYKELFASYKQEKRMLIMHPSFF